MTLENIFILKELLTCETPNHPWLLKHCHFNNCIKMRLDKNWLTKMFCVILKHHSWESEVKVILSVIVSFTEAIACAAPIVPIRYRYDTTALDCRGCIGMFDLPVLSRLNRFR